MILAMLQIVHHAQFGITSLNDFQVRKVNAALINGRVEKQNGLSSNQVLEIVQKNTKMK